jgi:alkyl sulfatase BDS1-like metallo-beta-lactamase superfamily hydrolase
MLSDWRRAQWAVCSLMLAAAVAAAQSEQSKPAQQSEPAEPNVAAANRSVQSLLRFEDRQDIDDAKRGFVATTADPTNPDPYAFLEHAAPSSVNPSLWRQAQLDVPNGLFKVADGVYQVCGFSVSSMTIVEGLTGIIVIDTGNYQWVDEVMNQVVFADPSNKAARNLEVDALEQLGYLAESAPWRNAYLLAINAPVLHAMTIAQVFDYLGTRVDGPKARAARIVINWKFSDTHESLASRLQHDALLQLPENRSDRHGDGDYDAECVRTCHSR